jgi:hypothetical protein
MSTDKPVNLNLAVPDFGAQGLAGGFSDRQGSSNPKREEVDAKTRERFDSLLGGEVEKNQHRPSASLLGPAGPAGLAGPKSVEFLPQPFALFQSQDASTETPVKSLAADLLGQVNHLVGRLMVGNGSSGNRQVRIDIQDDQLPGVTLTVQQIDGRLQVDFVCSVDVSRLHLNRAAPDLAAQLAERLSQDVLIRVQTDDDEDLCLYEIVEKAQA